jgi:hypothetical protein
MLTSSSPGNTGRQNRSELKARPRSALQRRRSASPARAATVQAFQQVIFGDEAGDAVGHESGMSLVPRPDPSRPRRLSDVAPRRCDDGSQSRDRRPHSPQCEHGGRFALPVRRERRYPREDPSIPAHAGIPARSFTLPVRAWRRSGSLRRRPTVPAGRSVLVDHHSARPPQPIRSCPSGFPPVGWSPP